MSSLNSLIIANLEVLHKESQTSKESKDRFRAKAYRNAIKAIKGCDYELVSGKGALQLKGVGKRISEKIQEIIDTGELHQVSDMGEEKLEMTKVLSLFASIWGVGPVKAKELWDLGARTINDVTEDYSHLLNTNQKIGLKYFDDLQIRVPHKQVASIAKDIMSVIREIQHELHWSIKARVCGSFRRKSPTCGDMDLLLCENGDNKILKELVDRLTESGLLVETLGIGPTKYLGITQTGDGTYFRIDMEVVNSFEWPFAMLYFTGDGPFNEKQRLLAKKMGYSLSEHGLKDVKLGTYVQGISSVRQIFTFLGMEYLAPWER